MKLLPRIIINCSLCGNELRRSTSEIERNVSGKFYCSRACQYKARMEYLTSEPVKKPRIEVWNEAKIIEPPITEYGLLSESLTPLQIGNAGESLVRFDLAMRGFSSWPTSQEAPFDLIADFNGTLLKIQVKSTAKPKVIPQRNRTAFAYYWGASRSTKTDKEYTNRHCDIMAFAALDSMKVAYSLLEETPAKRFSLQIAENKHRKQFANFTWDSCIAKYLAKQKDINDHETL